MNVSPSSTPLLTSLDRFLWVLDGYLIHFRLRPRVEDGAEKDDPGTRHLVGMVTGSSSIQKSMVAWAMVSWGLAIPWDGNWGYCRLCVIA